MWKPGSLQFDPEQAAVVLNDADDIVAAEGIWKFVTLAGGDTVRVPDTENGNLFAAAPELLAALESFLRAPSIGSNGPGTGTIVVQTYNVRAAERAIAKAKGVETT